MLELQSDGQWPLLHAAGDEDGYGHIAAYVTPTPVDRLLQAGYRLTLRHEDLLDPTRDRETVAGLWRALVDKNLRYAEPPWNPSEGQRIRDPEWLLRRVDQGAGTCIDLSLLFAAQCLNKELDTYLVMLQGPGYGHVMVAVWLGMTAGDQPAKRVPAGTTRSIPGVLAIDDSEALIRDRNVLLLDAVIATEKEPDRSLEAAISSAGRHLRDPAYERRRLIDVAVRQQSQGDEPLEPPRSRGALHARIAAPGRAVDFDAHKAARSTLQTSTGKIIVSGPQGVGKSTLVRKVAEAHDNGYGWFLNASSREAFDTALAEHELIESGESFTELDAVERQGKARDALERLRRTEDQWVIVIDNANAGAKDFDDPATPSTGCRRRNPGS